MPVGTLSLPLGSVLTGQPEVIGSSVLAGAAASVVFKFPTVYRAVLIECYLKVGAGNGRMSITFNGDTGANYSYQRIDASGATVTGARATGQTSFTPGQGTGVSPAVELNMLITKTTAAAKAQVVSQWANKAVAAMTYEVSGGEWNNTADLLTSVTFTGAEDLATNTSITCWGWRL